jgi:HAD superfamily hydrolase (TIGR01509 family)
MLLIFDCDGVLVDSEALACEIDAQVLTRIGLPYSAQDIARKFVGVSFKDMVARLEAEHACTLPADLGAQIDSALFAKFETNLKPIKDIRETILSLPYPRCVASSSTPERITLSLRITGLSDLFGNIFSATQVKRGKPAPDLFLHAAKIMSVNPRDCIVIEDSGAGVQGALAADMQVIGFVGGAHCGPEHAGKLQQAGASVVIDRMSELPEMIRQLILPRS